MGVLARISHRPSTTHADRLAVKGRTPCSRLDVVSATPSPSSGPCPPSQRHLDALATNGGEICRLDRGSTAGSGPSSCIRKERAEDARQRREGVGLSRRKA